MSLRYAELFAGAGGLSMGLERAGWECVFHAEWDDNARAVLSHHWPDVPLYGDVTTLDGRALTAAHGPIDLLTGGSPCQDLSVAGKRAGLGEGDLYKCPACGHSHDERTHRAACPKCGSTEYENVMITPTMGPHVGETFDTDAQEWIPADEAEERTRSSLFFEQMRLWEETGADLCLWENVDGARSSNAGKDFGEVLRAFVGAAVPVPSDGWRSAGVAAGPTGVAAWRVLDAQFFGVPQRRRRVFVLGTRTGRVDPAEVLSLAESVCGDPAPRREAREGAPADARESIGFQSSQSGFRSVDTFATLDANYGSRRHNGVLAFDWQKGNDKDNVRPSTMNVLEEQPNTLGATRVPAVLAFDLAQITSATNRTRCEPDLPASTISQASRMHVAFADELAPTLNGTQRQQVDGAMTAHDGIPRRLTPRECERLMSWPDDHTLVPNKSGKPMSDSARYKLCGNGVASNVAHWIGERLALALTA